MSAGYRPSDGQQNVEDTSEAQIFKGGANMNYWLTFDLGSVLAH